MKIRAITGFVALNHPADETAFIRMVRVLDTAQQAYEGAGITVQSRRMALQPIPRIGVSARGLPAFARWLRELADAHGVNYVALGPVGAADDPAYVEALAEGFAAAPGIFASIDITSVANGGRGRGVDLALLKRTARVIQQISQITPDGLTNLYLAASANVKPHTPFFPAAYHDGDEEVFALAIEAADLAVEAFSEAETPDSARQRLTAAIQQATGHLLDASARVVMPTSGQTIRLHGLDFSLAPYPGEATSLAGAMERLGVRVGGGGMIAAASLVMNAIEAVQSDKLIGFSGLMLPVLEDTVLGLRAGEGTLRINDLLLYSAICGTGLDCIPLPGDVDEAALTGMLLDTASLALRLDKPLTARLMPLPGKAVGDPVAFPDFEYFVPSRVMQPPGGPGAGALGGDTSFGIEARRPGR